MAHSTWWLFIVYVFCNSRIGSIAVCDDPGLNDELSVLYFNRSHRFEIVLSHTDNGFICLSFPVFMLFRKCDVLLPVVQRNIVPARPGVISYGCSYRGIY